MTITTEVIEFDLSTQRWRLVMSGDRSALERDTGPNATGGSVWSKPRLQDLDWSGCLDAVLAAVVRADRERLPSGDAPPQEPSACVMCEGRPVRRLCLDDRDALVDWLNAKSASGWDTSEVDTRTGVAECPRCAPREAKPSEQGTVMFGNRQPPRSTGGRFGLRYKVVAGALVYDDADARAIGDALVASRPPGGAEGYEISPRAGWWVCRHRASGAEGGMRATMADALADAEADRMERASVGAAHPPQPLDRNYIGSMAGSMGIDALHAPDDDLRAALQDYADRLTRIAGGDDTQPTSARHSWPVEPAELDDLGRHRSYGQALTPEPSGVPDATGWWWRLYGAEFEYETPTHVWFNVKPHGCHMYEGLDGPEPVTDGSRWGGKVERCTPGPSRAALIDAATRCRTMIHGAEPTCELNAEHLPGLHAALAREIACALAGIEDDESTDGITLDSLVSRCTPDADAGTLEALRGAEADLRRIAEMFGDEQGSAVELAAEHAGLRDQLLDITPHVESLRDALSERRGHALMHESAKFICKLLRAALEVKS